MALRAGADRAHIPPHFRPGENPLRLGGAFGSLGLADPAMREAWLHEAAEHGAAPTSDFDVHGNDPDAVGAVTDQARELADRIEGYIRLAQVTGDDVNQSVITADARLPGDSGGGRADERRARRTAEQTADQILMAQMQYHQEMANRIGDYLAEGNFAVGADGRLENAEMEQQLRDYERRMGLPPGSIDRHDSAAVRHSLEEQQEWHRTQYQDYAQRVGASADISASIQGGASASAAIAGHSSEAIYDAARLEARRGFDGARAIYEADGRTEHGIELLEEMALEGGIDSFAPVAEPPPATPSTDDESPRETDDSTGLAAGDVALAGDSVAETVIRIREDGHDVALEVAVDETAGISEEGTQRDSEMETENDAPPSFPGFG